MTVLGFDLHKRYITARALESGGAVLAASRQLPTTIATVLELAGLGAAARHRRREAFAGRRRPDSRESRHGNPHQLHAVGVAPGAARCRPDGIGITAILSGSSPGLHSFGRSSHCCSPRMLRSLRGGRVWHRRTGCARRLTNDQG